MDGSCVVIVLDSYAPAVNHIAGVNLVFEEKRGDARLLVAIDYSPVDRGSAAVARQQRAVEIKRAQTGHGPHHFRKHPERYHYKQVGLERTKLSHKLLIFEPLGLHHFESGFERIGFDGRGGHVLAASGGFVGRGDHTHNVAPRLVEPP